MNIIIQGECFKKLIKVSTLRRQFFGDCARDILEKALEEIDIEDEKYKARTRYKTVGDYDENGD